MAMLKATNTNFFKQSIINYRMKRTFIRRVFKKTHKGDLYKNVTTSLKEVYKWKLLPLEEKYLFHEFHSPKLTDQDFEAKPTVMFMGQYSTGKTTLIKYLLEKDYPGMRIGPEPTTDKFIVIMGGAKESVIPGNALVSDPNKPFGPLSLFGNSFLGKFQCSNVPSPLAQDITFVDTPGILSGEKQRVDRGYDFTGVLQWFAERSDRIILLFDANKLDISDEFRRAIEVMRLHDEKIRIVLNKSDSVGRQELLRVYGALMWSLGKVLNTPEVARIFVGSFWSEKMKDDFYRSLFEDEEKDLIEDISSLPKNSALRKINELSKRARIAKVHAYLIHALKGKMPTLFGHQRKKEELIGSLDDIFEDLALKYKISRGDFPEMDKVKEILRMQDFSKFKSLDKRLVDKAEDMMANDIPHIMEMILDEVEEGGEGATVEKLSNPFFENRTGLEQMPAGTDARWQVEKSRAKYDEIFDTLEPDGGKISTIEAEPVMKKSRLPNSVLGKIWTLSDVDKDGQLDADEFALAMYLIDVKLQGYDLPAELPQHLIPPSKLANYCG